jgi:hypothetical protein
VLSREPNEHYPAVLNALVKGRVTPLLGAGAGMGGRVDDAPWAPGCGHLPTAGELALYLAETFNYPADEVLELARVAQHVAVIAGLGPLYLELREVFEATTRPSRLHEFLARLPAFHREAGRPRYQLILTTNYDDALERAFAAAGEAFDLVWYSADGSERGKFWHRDPAGDLALINDPNAYDALSLDVRTVILKLHGTIDRSDRNRDSYVITEDHYTDYLTRSDIDSLVPVRLSERMAWSHFLLLGHSMRDWNLRVILYRIWGHQKLNFKSWSIQRAPSELEIRFWKDRGDVEIIDEDLDSYVGALEERLWSSGASEVPA